MLLKKIQNLQSNSQFETSSFYLKEIYKCSLFSTTHTLLNYTDVNQRTHREVIESLESNTKRKLIVMPRGTFKSSICSVAYPIWLLINNPNLRILLDGEVYTNSKNFLREIKLHLQSPRLKDLFGKFETRKCWTEGEIIIGQRTKVLKEASITAGGIGSEKTGQHYDVIIMDDLNSPTNSNTQDGRERVIRHYRYNTSILEPKGLMVVVGTRYAEDDCIGFVLSNEIEYKKEASLSMHGKKQDIYLVCGVPGSGKTWVCEQVKDKFNYVPNDRFIGKNYSGELKKEAFGNKPVLADCPFGERLLKQALEADGFHVIPIFIVEGAHVVRYRYEKREGKHIPQSHLTRAGTIKDRALEWKAKFGTSEEVLKLLKDQTP